MTFTGSLADFNETYTIPLHSPWRGPSLSLRPGFRAVRSLADQELF